MTADVSDTQRDDMKRDLDFMAAALSIGRRRLGETGENPAVGALVVRDGIVIAQGFTERGGRPHAEPMALAQAGDAARGATLYVTLEPCSHHGRTPPCAEAIVATGIARVVSAMEDPDARVAGRGHALLREAGIDVTIGVCEAEARRVHRGHILRATQTRPTVTLKLAETRDGYAAGTEHDPRLVITSAAANGLTHMMRAMHDAIMVGIGTLRGDDPLMTVRLPGLEHRKPVRVVLDTHFAMSRRSRLAASARETPVLAIGGEGADAAAQAELDALGIATSRVAVGGDGRVDVAAALTLLALRGHSRIFCEGGPTVASALIAKGLADEVVLFTAQKPLGREGVSSLSQEARALIENPAHYILCEDVAIGPDRLRRYERIA
jgi:diaminohydroxyphosphoribosylaminopyrimidine deaminase/5-amino-6-(5-phosphoribosylamino)uracil reductase